MPWSPRRRAVLAVALPALLDLFAALTHLQAQQPPPWIEVPKRPAPAFPALRIAADRLAVAKGFVRVDVRSAREYAAGHLPRALRLDLGDLARRCPARERSCLGLALGALGVAADLPVALYGADLETVARAFLRLEEAGVGQVRWLEGGIEAWKRAGLPLERRSSHRGPLPFGTPTERVVTLAPQEVFARLGGPELEVLDLRDGVDWTTAGYAAPPLFAAGHVPRSLPWNARGELDAHADLPAAEAELARFSMLGPRAGDRVDPGATFALLGEGESDPRPALAYLKLRSMGLEVSVVAGGIAAWRAAGLPLVEIVGAGEVAALLDPAALAGNRLPARAAILDLRELPDYREGHVPGAAPVPLAQMASGLIAAVEGRWPGLDRSAVPLVLYCYGVECIRSRDAAGLAAREGFRRILWFREGMAAWRTAGLPVAR